MVRAGETPIPGTPTVADADGHGVRATFDLSGRPRGPWDVVIDTPGRPQVTIPGAFTIEAATDARPWVQLLGREVIRAGGSQRYQVRFGNRGNVDAHDLALILELPTSVEVDVEIPEPDITGLSPSVPLTFFDEGRTVIPWWLMRLAAGSSDGFSIVVSPTAVPANQSFSLSARILSFSSPFALSGAVADAASSPVFLGIEAGLNAGLRAAGEEQLPEVVRTTLLERVGDVFEAAYPKFEAMGIGVGRLAGWAWIETGATLGGYVAQADLLWKFVTGNIRNAVGALESATSELNPRVVTSVDPNDKVGPPGVGSARYMRVPQALAYVVHFENVATATAPAQIVRIVDDVDVARFDDATLELGPITFGAHTIRPPAHASEFHAEVDLRPAQAVIARIDAVFDAASGRLVWTLAALDPTTRQVPDDPLLGLLPPNAVPPDGEGSVTFSIAPRGDIADGDVFANDASITFDTNEPIATPPWVNTIDEQPPVTSIDPLPSETSADRFDVTWKGTDEGAGVDVYSLFVSTDGGPFAPLLEGTTSTAVTFQGAPNRLYGFLVLGTDRVGNAETKPALAEVETRTSSISPATSTTTIATTTLTTTTLEEARCHTVTCFIATVLENPFCPDLPHSVRKKLQRAAAAARNAAETAGRRRTRRVAAAKRALAMAARRADRLSRKTPSKLSPACTLAIRTAIDSARKALSTQRFQ